MIDFEKSVLPSLLCDTYLFSPYAYLAFFVKSQSLFKNCKFTKVIKGKDIFNYAIPLDESLCSSKLFKTTNFLTRHYFKCQ